jgi:hypothetical protein
MAVITIYVRGGGELKAKEALSEYLAVDDGATSEVPVRGSTVREAKAPGVRSVVRQARGGKPGIRRAG